jgi:hypothetical protein
MKFLTPIDRDYTGHKELWSVEIIATKTELKRLGEFLLEAADMPIGDHHHFQRRVDRFPDLVAVRVKRGEVT